MDLRLETLDFIESSNALNEKQAAVVDAIALKTAAAAEAIPGVVQAILAAGLINPTQKVAMAETLSDPVLALDFLKRVAEAAAAPQTNLGRPAPELRKQGSANNNVPSIHTPSLAAQRAFLAPLGL